MSATPLWDLAAIAAETNLSPRKVRDYLDKLKDLLHPLKEKGENANQVYFGEAGLQAFQRIKALRDSGFILPQIREQLSQELCAMADPGSLPRQTPANAQATMATAAPAAVANPGKSEETAFVSYLQNELEKSRKREDDLSAKLATANDERVAQERQFRAELKTTLQDLAAEQKKVERQNGVLLQLTGGMPLQDYQQHVQAVAKQREHLTAELHRLDGKWFKGKKRKGLLKELAALG